MRTRNLRNFIALFLVLLMWSSPVMAKTPTAAEQEAAREAFDQGALFYTQGEYGRAIVEFLKGHELAPHAMFLYNISLSYEHLGNMRQALNAAERAKGFEGMPDAVAVRNDARIVAFRVLMASESTSLALGKPVDPPIVPPEPEPPLTEPMFGGLGWIGVAATGVGVALLGGAGYMQLAIQPNLVSYEEAGTAGNRSEYDSLRTTLEGQQATGKFLLYGGGALVGTGIILMLVDRSGRDEGPRRVVVQAAPAPGGAVLGLRLSY